MQHESVSFSCVNKTSLGECAGLGRHRMLSDRKQISGLLVPRQLPAPPPPDLQLEGRPLQTYTDCAGSKRHSCECCLDRPLTSSVIGRALTSIPRRSPLAVHPEGLWLGSPAKWEEFFLPPGMRLWAMNMLSEIK